MKAIILAAGYATRLYPLTRDRPKPLLPVGGRPILEHLLERLTTIEALDGIYVVTNAKFTGPFREWARAYRPPRAGLEPQVVDDGTTDDSNKLGAIGDLALVLDEAQLDDDIVVAAGDNLFTEDLAGFGHLGPEKDAPVLAVYDVGDLETIKRYSSISVDSDGRITFFEEKPAQPTSTLAGIALYYYPRSALALIHAYIADGNNPDQPGHLIAWLYRRVPVYTWRVPGRWYDIGSHETLAEADRAFTELAQT